MSAESGITSAVRPTGTGAANNPTRVDTGAHPLRGIGADFMADEQTPLGSIIDQLGCAVDLDEGDLVSSAVVVLAVLVPDEPNPRLAIACSDGLGWIEQAGLLRLAERICSEPPDMDE